MDELVEELNEYAKTQKLKDLAKMAGVSGAAVSDYKNGKKLIAPEFRKIYQVAYALIKRPPCKLSIEPEKIPIMKIKQAMSIDKTGLILKLAEVIIGLDDEEDLQFIATPINLLYNKIYK